MQSDHLKNIFKIVTILAQKQPKIYSVCYLKLDLILTPITLHNQRGILNIEINAAKSCWLYANEGNNFVMSNSMRWELRSHVTCRGINVIYYLKCKKRILEKRPAIMLLALKVESISTLVIVEQVFPLVNFPYTYIIVP